MAFTPLESSDEPKSSGGFVPLEKSATPPVESTGGAAFGVYPKPGMKPNEQVSRAATNIGRSATEALPGSFAGLAGFGGGMEIGAAIGAWTSPILTPAAIPVLGFTGGLLGAFGSSTAVTALQDKIHKTLFPEDWATRQQEKQAHPYEAFAGETLANLAGMSPKTMAAPVTEGMSKLGRLASTDIGQRTISAGLQTSIEAGSELVREGKVDPVKLGVSAATGAAMPGFNPLGKKVFGAGESVGKAVTDKMFKTKPTTTTTETTDQTTTERTKKDRKKSSLIESSQDHSVNTLDAGTISVTVNRLKDGGVMVMDNDGVITEYNPAFVKDKSDADILKYLYEPLGHKDSSPIKKPPSEEESKKAGFIKKVSEEVTAEKAAADAKIPLVQTALKNKDTGEIELLGPKHSEARKAETKDTHEQGFVDESGTFLNRKDAWNRAKSAGQIPEGQSPESFKEGLHSGDLRKAGDDRFKLADVPKEANGVPIEEGTTGTTRKDGRPIGATFRKKDGKIIIDTPTLYEQYGEKPWTKPKVEGVYPIAEDAFPTFQDYVDFIVAHESEHTVTPIAEGQTKAQYENQTNQRALKQLAEKKAAAPKEVPPAPVDTSLLGERPVVTDRTKTDPRDVKDEQELYDIAKEIYAKHGEVETVKFYEGYREYQKTWEQPVKEVEKFVGTNINNKMANERIIHNNADDLKTMAGKDVNLEQLSFDIDKGVTLTGKAKEIADKFRALMDDLGKRALEKGVIKGWHQDYVARNVISEGAAPPGALEEFMKDAFGYGGKASGEGTATTTKYGKERRLKTREDLVEHIKGINEWLEQKGKDYRFKLKTDNLAEIYKDYAMSVEKSIENKNLVDNIKQIRNVEGESLIRPITTENPRPYGWETIEHAELDGYAIHPDLVPDLRFVFDTTPGKLMQAFGAISQFVKRFNVIGSFFHAKSLMEVMSSAKIPLWTPIKEAIVLPALEKTIKGATGKDLQMSAISQAVEQFKTGGVGSNTDLWIRGAGLELKMNEDISKGILTSAGKLTDTMIGKFGPKTRALESTMSTVEKYTLDTFDKYTWDYLHTGGKLMVADAYLDKARRQAAEQGKPFDEMAARKEIALFVNDSFGGLNWHQAATSAQSEFAKRMTKAAYSPQGRRALQVLLFAPDWTISTVRAFSSALPKNLNPTKWKPIEGVKGMMTPTTRSDYARLYQFKTALTYLTLINGINMITANRPVWENKDPTRVEWPDGTSMQAMKHAMEPYHWLSDPDKTLSNKLGFVPKAVIIGVGGLEYASPNAPKLVDRGALSRLGAVAKTVAPFQVQAATDAPQGEGVKRALLGTMGFPVYGSTSEQRKLANAERELATKEQAWKYRDKEIKAGRIDWTPKHDRDKQSLEKRRQKINEQTGKE